MPRPRVPRPGRRHLVAEVVDGLPARPADVVLALGALAGRRRLAALSGDWTSAPLLVTADPTDVHEDADVTTAGGSFDGVAALLDSARLPLDRDPRTPSEAVGGGWVTVLGHALGRTTGRVRTPPAPSRGPRVPDVVAAFHDHVLRFDGDRWWAEALDAGDGAATARAQALAQLVRAAGRPRRLADGEVRLEGRPDEAAHMAAVEQVVTAVRAGDIAQANVCTRFGLRLPDGDGAAVRAWVALVEALSPDRAALVTGPWGALVGASPELYLQLAEGRVRSAPIKGTRPAGDGRALLDSVKDASENVMIVDLVRNDLARVCEPGSVAVDELLAVAPHTGVAHLVSRVSGRLVPGAGPGEVVRATFPPGSVTGTPKQRATEVTDALEPAARGAHTGAAGLLGPVLQELAVTIRSLEVAADGRAALGVGGGIVADSTPSEEWHEVLTKAAPLLRALHVDAVRPGAGTAAAKGVADAAAGLLETLLVLDGRVVEAADHVARLRRSVWELTGRPVAADLQTTLAEAARGAGGGAHRLRVRLPDLLGDPVVELEPWHRPVPADRSPGLVLGLAAAAPDGSERHKYADRRWVARALAAGGGDVDDVALVDASGALLETTRSNIFAVLPGRRTGGPPDRGPRLVTPACDGRLLPGVTRQVVVDLAGSLGLPVRLGPLGPAVVAAADGVFTTNALRGVQWVRVLGDRSWQVPDPVTTQLSHALLRRWGPRD